MSTLSAKEYKCFEDIKRIRPDGSEYWAARELAPVLDYAKWENFYKVIKRAMIACENSGRSTLECFPEVRKTSPMPNGGVKDILDYELSRYACYLIVQNGDPRKEVIALGQTYFAIQTYRQEVADRFMVIFTALPNIFFGYNSSGTDTVIQMTQQAMTLGGVYMTLGNFEGAQIDSVVTGIAAEYEKNGTTIDHIVVSSAMTDDDLLWVIAINSAAHQQDLNTTWLKSGTITLENIGG